jgi:hypothetical protein
MIFLSYRLRSPHRGTVLYEDITEAQAKRNATEAAVVKGKRGRKRKSSETVVARTKRARESEMEVAKDEIEALEFGITTVKTGYNNTVRRAETYC